MKNHDSNFNFNKTFIEKHVTKVSTVNIDLNYSVLNEEIRVFYQKHS